MKDNLSNKADSLTVLPEPTGPYCIGIAKYDLEHIYRKDLLFPQGRLIPIQIYFPTQKGNHDAYQKTFEKRAALGPFELLNVEVHSQTTDISFLANSEHPLIFLNHGSCVAMTDYAFLTEDLSSHGYVVISI